jgi:hypothetical protein
MITDRADSPAREDAADPRAVENPAHPHGDLAARGGKGDTHLNRGMPALIAAGVLFGGFILGAILVGADLVFLGVIVGASAVPAAFITWVMAGDRYY